MFNLIFILCSYLIGCLTIGYYLVKIIKGKDIRFIGTGSTGARNVGRVLGWFGFLVTVVWDFGKGFMIVYAARYYHVDLITQALAINAVVIGHVWPMQLGFKGGKGFATTSGVLFAMNAQFHFILLLPLALFFSFSRNIVLSGLLTVIFAPILGIFLIQSRLDLIGIAFLSLFVLIAHRSNIQNILRSQRYEPVPNSNI